MATRTRAVAAASESHVADAAMAMFPRGNAVDAVVAGVFAAAAAAPGVLLGPVQILFGGAGLGLRAVDGRVRQPGKGAPRPRGFTEEQVIAPASRVGVPTLPAALAAALATSGASTLTQVMAPALAAADGPRKDVLKTLARRGPSALLEESIAGELINTCGRIAGGVLTREDLDAVLPVIVPAEQREHAQRSMARVPWRDRQASPKSAAYVHVVAVSDTRGLVAVACYERREDGVSIPALALTAPSFAAPVLRGQTRVTPGEPISSASPMALVWNVADGLFDLALGVASDAEGEEALENVLAAFDAETRLAPRYSGMGALVGVARGSEGGTILARH